MEQPRVEISKSHSTKPKWKEEDEVTLTFSKALEALVHGATITRLEWDDPTVYGKLRDGILMLHRHGDWFQWIINEGDLRGTDWFMRR